MQGKGRGGMYVPQREQGRSQRTRSVFVLLGIVAVVGWFYVLFISDLFVVNAVEVRGASSLDPVDVSREVFSVLDERTVWRPWSTRHAWFINRQALEDELKSRLFAENVTVDKINGNVLRLTVEERSSTFIFQSHQQYFWADLQGAALNELTSSERASAQARILGSRLPSASEPPIIHRDLNDFISAGFRIADSDQVKSWLRAASDIQKAGMVFREFDPPDASSTVATVVSQEGFKVFVDTQDPLLPQIKTYQAFDKARPAGLVISQYVDVRVPGKVFVK